MSECPSFTSRVPAPGPPCQEPAGRDGLQIDQGLLSEISERRGADQVRRDTEARNRLLVENASELSCRLFELCSDAIYIRCEDRVALVNPAAMRLFGATRAEQIIGKSVLELVHPDWRSVIRRRMETLRATGKSHPPIPEQFLRLDGSTLEVEVAAAPLSVGGKEGALVILRDMSERKNLDSQLRKLSQTVEQSPAAILITDLEGRIEYVNPVFCKVTGYGPRELLGHNPRLLKSGQTPPEVYQRMWATLKAGKEWRGELCNRRKNGELFWEFAVLSPLRDAARAVTHYVGIKEDITEKKALERQLLRSQRVESIGTLAAGIAHDLNNILAPIMMSAQLLGCLRPDEEQAQILATIQASARRGADIVKQVLTFARGTEGERLLLQPRHLIGEMQAIAQETFPKNLVVRSSLAKGLWPVSGDATQLHQVLLNLCVNARDAMPEGGVLVLSAENVQVTTAKAGRFADGKVGPHVLIRVSDTGHGIAPAMAEKIFDPFFTTKEQGKGTGLGLSTALGIVRSHGGFVDVESDAGRGTTFAVYLPAEPSQTESRGSAGLMPVPRGAGEGVLVVDDEANIRSAYQRTLARYGYEVVAAANGSEALALLASHARVKAVVTDVMMPVMDGVALTRALRELHPELPVIVCTGWGEQGVETELAGLGIASFLHKPYPSEQLLGALHKCLAAQLARGR